MSKLFEMLEEADLDRLKSESLGDRMIKVRHNRCWWFHCALGSNWSEIGKLLNRRIGNNWAFQGSNERV